VLYNDRGDALTKAKRQGRNDDALCWKKPLLNIYCSLQVKPQKVGGHFQLQSFTYHAILQIYTMLFMAATTAF
jgi:hypothetical protein